MKFRIFLFLIFVSNTCFGQETEVLDVEEASIFKKFIEVLTKESELGYVLFDKKPVCIHGFYSKDPFRVNTPSHKQSVAIREGVRIWKKIAKESSNITIHVCDREDPFIPGYIHVLAINIPLFHRVVNESLPLFQYVLGPTTNSSDLLKSLLSNQDPFHLLLKNDKVLIGKILGFGLQNSLYVSRIENLQQAFQSIVPPFKPCHLYSEYFEHEYSPCSPSFGFKSVDTELEALKERVTISSEKLIQKSPEFIFGWVKDSEEEKKFISDLENTQTKIQAFLKSPDFLQKTFQLLTGLKYLTVSHYESQPRFEKDQINKIIARGLWESLQIYDEGFLPYFIQGMENPDYRLTKNLPRLAYFPNYRREVIEAKRNLKLAAELFRSYDESKDVKPLVPQLLYFKILNPGFSQLECNSPLVSLDFSIFSPEGHCLNFQSNKRVNLNHTIPGFAQGIKGMKIGETREIFIHPSLGYGFETSIDKCVPLRAVVTLLDVHESSSSFLTEQSLDLSFLLDEEILVERTEDYKKVLIERGQQVSEHLKKNSQVDLVSICEELKHYVCDSKGFLSTTQEEQDFINKVHWNIYFEKDLDILLGDSD